jgi:hypothetical protein
LYEFLFENKNKISLCFRSVSYWLLFASLLSQQNVDFLLDPVLVVRRIGETALVKDKTTEVSQLIDEIKQMTYVVRDRRRVGIESFQMFFVHFANSLSYFRRNSVNK